MFFRRIGRIIGLVRFHVFFRLLLVAELRFLVRYPSRSLWAVLAVHIDKQSGLGMTTAHERVLKFENELHILIYRPKNILRLFPDVCRLLRAVQ